MPSPNIVTTLALNEPATLLAFGERAETAPQFLIRRYFGTNPVTDIFPTEDVLIDYKDKHGRKLAPLVHQGYKTGERRTFHTDRLTPARIAPKRRLTVADLMQRGYGESLFSGKSGQDRAISIVIDDMADMNASIKRRWEAMAGQLIVQNKYSLPYEQSDAAGDSEDITEQEVSFIDDADGNISLYTPSTTWDNGSALMVDIIGDIKAMCRQVQRNGGRAVDLLLGGLAADVFLKNDTVKAMLDNRRMEMGAIKPEELGEACLLGYLNVDGYRLNVICYDETYTDADGNQVPYLDEKAAVVLAPGCGRKLHAAVTQLEQSDNNHHTYSLPIVPKYIGDVNKDELSILMTSRPVLCPNVKGCFVAATVVSDAPYNGALGTRQTGTPVTQ